MAYADDALLDEEKNGQATAPSIGASSANLGASSPKSPNTQQSPSDIAQRGSGSFQNLGEYLKINAPQQFGQQVAGKIGDEINQAGQTIDSAKANFENRVDANTIKDTNNLAGQVATDPRQVNANDFAKVRDAQYGGPQSLSDAQDLYSQVQGAAGTATGKANASQSESGRFALLDSYFGNPKYSQGQKSLDNLLIQNDPGSQQAFQQMRQNADALGTRSQALFPELSNYASTGKAATEQTRNAARGAVGIDNNGNLTGQGAIGAIESQLPQRLTNANAQRTSQYQDAQNLAAQNKFGLTPEFLQAMGLNGKQQGYGVDPSQYLSQGQPLNQSQVVTPDEASRLQALQSLGGTGPLVDDYSQVGQTSPAYSFNKDAYDQNVKTQQTAYSNAVAPINAQVSDLQVKLNDLKKSDPNQIAQQNAYQQQINQLLSQKTAIDGQYLGTFGPASGNNGATFDPTLIGSGWRS